MNPFSPLFPAALFTLAGFALLPPPAAAQQRDPALEVYALSGTYFHGNLSASNSWRPQFGGGLIVPVGRNWGAVADVVTSTVGRSFAWQGQTGEPNSIRERRVVLLPAFVRFWRRDRFSIYAGGGVGFEHERQRSRILPVAINRSMGESPFGTAFVTSNYARTDAMLNLRVGVIVSLSKRIVWRTGFSFLPRYVDETASKSVEAGIGYRF
jgi:hypothetical protein